MVEVKFYGQRNNKRSLAIFDRVFVKAKRIVAV
jgi:hypothetical protein